MAHFVEEKDLERVKFDDGEWVDIREDIPFVDFANSYKEEESGGRGDRSTKLMMTFIADWSFVGKNGEKVEINEKNLKKLSIGTASKILSSITPKVDVDKKKDQE